MARVDASLVQQIFDVSKLERETDIQHHRKADDLGAGFEVLERGRSGHGKKLRNHPARLKPSSSDKAVPPISDNFVAYVDASLMQQIFDIPKQERETDAQHHRKADDLGTGFEVFEIGRSGHGQKLRNNPTPLNQSSSDKTNPAATLLIWLELK